MEDTHGGADVVAPATGHPVLILIIMEDTHGAPLWHSLLTMVNSLNPYYNGRYSWRIS